MKHRDIPLTKPYWGDEEIRKVTECLQMTSGIGDGPNTRKLQQQLKKVLDVPYVLPVPSCTHGLELILRCLGLTKGDEVIVPSFTMPSTANAVILAGGTPVFADIEPVRYTIDPKDVSGHITSHTKGIILVHYAGMPCLMEDLCSLAKDHHLFIIEDAAHAIGALYKGKALGTFGLAGAYSFHGTKNVSCGEGGAVVTKNAKLAVAMERYRANGTNRKDFIQGRTSFYTWVSRGSSYYLSDILASILTAQIPKIPDINARRASIAASYRKAFETYKDIVTLPVVPPHTLPNWHIWAFRFTKQIHTADFITKMHKKGIGVAAHYVPLHSSPMGKQFDSGVHTLPVTESVARTLVRMPIYPSLTDQELEYCIQEARFVLEKL